MRVLAWLGLLCGFSLQAVHAEETPLKPEQIDLWIKALNSDDFEARDKAEQSLRSAGPGAIPALEKAVKEGDTEVKQRANRCLETLRWFTRAAPADLAEIIPAESAFCVFTNDLKGAVVRARMNTIAGKLYDAPTLQPLKNALAAHIQSQAAWNTPAFKLLPIWPEHFGGPNGVSVTLATGEENRFAAPSFLAYYGINGSDREKMYQEYVTAYPLNPDPTAVKVENYRGVRLDTAPVIMQSLQGQGRAGAMILAGSVDEARRAIDRLSGETSPVISTNDEFYRESLKAMAPNPLVTLYLNTKKQESTMSFYGLLDFVGLKNASGILYTLNEKNGLFLEHLNLGLQGAREGWLKTMAQEQMGSVWLNTPPSNALGAVFFRFKHEMIPTLLNMNLPSDATQQVTANWEGLDADAAFWIPKPASEKDAVHWTGGLEFKDAASAARAWDDLQRTITRRLGKDFIPKVEEADGVKFYSSNWSSLLPNLLPNEWTPRTFCVSGKALLFGTSQAELKTIIERRSRIPDSLTSLSKDFQMLLAQIPTVERGALLYVNTPEVSTFLAPLIWKEMKAGYEIHGDLVYKIFTDQWQLPEKDLATVPGALLNIRDQPDGIHLKGVSGTSWILGVPGALALKQLWVREQSLREERSRQGLQNQLEKAAEKEK